MESVKTIMQELETCSNLIAGAIIKKAAPIDDDITENAARKAYGDKWLRKMKRDGLAKYTRVGRRILYSRHQLDCLLEAEREHAKLVFNTIGKKPLE